MLTRHLFFGAIVFVAAATFGAEKQADAAKRFGMSEIKNNTNQSLHYSIRWGNKGAWQNWTVAPGKSWIHYWKYGGNQASSPVLNIRFDDDLYSINNPLRNYVLIRYAGPEVNSRYTKKYTFVRDGVSGRYIDLKSTY